MVSHRSIFRFAGLLFISAALAACGGSDTLAPQAPAPAAAVSTMAAVPDNASFPVPATDVANFQAGNLYFNLHNPAFPLGVIRGQIDMTPTVIRFASLDNAQETTGSNSTGKGAGILAVDTVTGQLSGFIVHNVADADRAHIHLGARGIAGGILVPLTPVDLPSATMYAVPDNTFFPNPATDVAAFLADNLYFNVHNPAFPGGVIRGQIDMTPTVIKFASLDNTQETTGSNSTGKGAGLLAVDEATGRLGGFIVHNVADADRAHVHTGARGIAGGILVPLTPVDLPSATMYAVPDNVFFPVPATDVAAFLADNLYFNVHNPAFPGGVIRGQIDMEPTAIRFASLDNTQETTGSTSTGKGAGLLAVNELTGRIGGFLVHNVGDSDFAHIHTGARGIAGPVLVPLTLGD